MLKLNANGAKEIRIEIPHYIRRVPLSKAQRTLYYSYSFIDNDIRAKSTKTSKGKALLQKYINPKKKYRISYRNGRCTPDVLKKEYDIGIFYNKIYKDRFRKVLPKTSWNTIYNKPKEAALDVRFNFSVKHSEFHGTKQWDKIEYLLVDVKTKKPVIANPTQAGKPRYYVIRGQDIYSGNLAKHKRGTVMQHIKESFVDRVRDIPVIDFYPVLVRCEVHDTVRNSFDNTRKNKVGKDWDLGNRTMPYGKAFLDLLATGKTGKKVGKGKKAKPIQYFEPKILDDNRLYVTADPMGGIFCPLPTNDDTERKLVFVITEDKRPVVRNNPIYKEFFNW